MRVAVVALTGFALSPCVSAYIVFFVVSGWLITQNLYRTLEAQPKGVDLRAFYVGRIKRIAPAALVCIALTLAAALHSFSAADARLACQGALAAALSGTNVYQAFFADHGYFAPSSQSNPFLHLWSLAVEEQFYLLWPAVLGLLYRRFRSAGNGNALLLWAVGMLASISFLCAQLSAPSSFAYYMLVTRAWELLLGAGLGLWALMHVADGDGVKFSRGTAEWMGLAGLLLTGASLVWLSEVRWCVSCHISRSLSLSLSLFCSNPLAFIFLTPYTRLQGTPSFPGFMALPCCAGAALLLLSGATHHRTWTASLLSWGPLAQLGVVSYSAYLYHWPVLAFMRYFAVPLDGVQRVVALSHFVSLTMLSFHFVESRFRRVEWPSARAVTLLYVVPTLLIIAVSLTAPAHLTAPPPVARSNGAIPLPVNLFKTDGSCRLPYVDDTSIPGLQWDAVRHYGLDRWAKCDALTPNLCFIDDNSNDAFGCVKPGLSNCYAGDTLSSCDRHAIGVFGGMWARVCVIVFCCVQRRSHSTSDSFAAQHVGMLDEFGKAAHFSFFNFCVGLCPFFYWPEMSERCVVAIEGFTVLFASFSLLTPFFAISANPERPICLGRNKLAGEHLRRFAGRTIVWGGFWRLFVDRTSWQRFELYFTKCEPVSRFFRFFACYVGTYLIHVLVRQDTGIHAVAAHSHHFHRSCARVWHFP